MDTESKRADVFGGADDLLDTSEFAPRSKPKPAPNAEEVRAVAKEVGFQPASSKETQSVAPRRRRAKSRRTAQFNIKLTPETLEMFWAFAAKHEDDGEKAMSALLQQTSQ